jgi:hypothetical protein
MKNESLENIIPTPADCTGLGAGFGFGFGFVGFGGAMNPQLKYKQKKSQILIITKPQEKKIRRGILPNAGHEVLSRIGHIESCPKRTSCRTGCTQRHEALL